MIIYHSTVVRPYVYFGIHKVTGEIYVGYREANKLPSNLDLFIYRTSSKVVHPNFDEYDWYIVAEFFAGNDAYDFEQQLIYEHWDNPLLLNRHCNYGKRRFKSAIGDQISAKTRERMSAAKKGKLHPERCGIPSWNKGLELIGEKYKGGRKNKGKTRIFTEEHKKNIGLSQIGKTLSEETKEKLRVPKPDTPEYAAMRLLDYTNRGTVTCPHCSKEGPAMIMKRWHFDNCKTYTGVTVKDPRPKVTCPHCNKEGHILSMKRWHFDNCKHRT